MSIYKEACFKQVRALIGVEPSATRTRLTQGQAQVIMKHQAKLHFHLATDEAFYDGEKWVEGSFFL